MKSIVLTIATTLLVSLSTQATHIRAADITYKRTSSDQFTYEFTLTVYSDTQSPVRAGDGLINFGDGVELQLDIYAESFEDGIFLGPNNDVEVYIIKISHTYNDPGIYIISYREPNRNDEIVNINKGNSVQTKFYLQAFLVIDPLVGTNDSPVLNSFPIDRAFVGVKFTHNAWASDPEGDSLAFRLVFPLQDESQVVRNFERPNDPDFYINSLPGNEAQDGPPTFEIDPITGDLVWDAPGDFLANSQGPFSEYSVAFIVEEWRRVNDQWMRIGYVTRDMQIIVSGEKGGRPNFELPDHAIIAEGTNIDQEIEFSNFQQEDIKVSYFGEVFDLNHNAMMAEPVLNEFTTGPVNLNLQWDPQNNQLNTRPYLVHLKVESQGTDTEPAATLYQTWVLSIEELPEIIPPGISMPPTSTLVTNIKEFDTSNEVIFYPNPSEDLLFWKSPQLTPYAIQEISLTNMLGQQTKWPYHASYSQIGIPIAEIPPGWYMINLRSKKAIYRGTFIKK